MALWYNVVSKGIKWEIVGLPTVLLFSGTYRYSLDEKNRLVIPARFRETLNAEGVDKLFVVKGDSHLYVFPFPVFLDLSEKLKSWDFTKEASQAYVRLFYSDTFDVAPDRQGRIILRKDMCDQVGIADEVIIIGVLSRMEIWSPTRWTEFRDQSTLRGFSANLDAHSQL